MNSFFKQNRWATFGRRESATEIWNKCQEQKTRVPLFNKYPLFTFILEGSDITSAVEIQRTVESLKSQSYHKWELVILTGSSQSCAELAKRFLKEKRIRVVEKNNYEGASSQADYIGILRAGNTLNPSLLFHFTLLLQKEDCELLYCNDVIVKEKRDRLFSKPEYSYLTLINFNYIGDFWLIKASSFDLSALENAHLFLIQKASLNSSWKLVPVFGLHRGELEAKLVSDKVFEDVIEAVNRNGFTCFANRDESSWNILPDASVAIQTKVSVVICFRDKADWTINCLKKLERFAGNVPLEVLLVNNDSKVSELRKLKEFLVNYTPLHKVLEYPHAFNFGHMHNWAIRNYATGEYVFLLNNDVFLLSENRLKDMLGWAALPFVGTVGCLLRFKDGRIQHAGLTARFGGESRLARVGNEQSNEALWGHTREVFGNTFAACLMKRTTYDNLGGFREWDLANGFGDVAFNLECLKIGLRNMNLGYLEGLHLESASRGNSYEYWEECIVEQAYPELLQKMVRYDLGYDRMPIASSVTRDLKHYAKGKLRQSFPWLKDIKSYLIQLKSGVNTLQENYKT